MNLNGFDAILFDLDGTLNNTIDDIAIAMNRALRMNGLPGWETEDYKLLVGNGVKVLAQRAVRDRQELADAVGKDYQDYYGAHSTVLTAPYPGIPELLRTLQRMGKKLCVLSNKPDADTKNVIAKFYPEIGFAVVQGQIPGVPVKPDPAAALNIAEKLGVPPERFAYLGDTKVDMSCAVNAGMFPVGVLWGFRSREELVENGAKILIAHPMELIGSKSD